jgi:hypothetical protein
MVPSFGDVGTFRDGYYNFTFMLICPTEYRVVGSLYRAWSALILRGTVDFGGDIYVPGMIGPIDVKNEYITWLGTS